jgi:cell wall-associated NlpC family hydrolase
MPIDQPMRIFLSALVSFLALGFAAQRACAEQAPWLSATGLAALDVTPAGAYPHPVPPRSVSSTYKKLAFSPIRLVMDLANGLRNIRYRRGGREPSTGFDCSGFVHYVFRQGIGVDLPNTSAAQFRSGQEVARKDLRDGDLVFFRTRGKRISHVGIYVGQGQFIHAPSTGKRVSVSSLSAPYWARRFAGAKRPEVLAVQANTGPDAQG